MRQLTPLGVRSKLSMNSGKVVQSHLGASPSCMQAKGIASLRVMLCMARSRSSTREGANPKPQFPMATEVTPCQPDIVQYGSQKYWASKWVWRSTKPGATIRPLASRTLSADAVFKPPILATLPSLIARSLWKRGVRVPSTMVPFLIIRS